MSASLGRLLAWITLAALPAHAQADTDGGIDAGDDVAALIARLEHASTIESIKLKSRLEKRGPVVEAALPVLLARAKAASWDDRAAIVRALGVIADESCVPFLTDALSSPDWRVVLAAGAALGGLGAVARPALPTLTSVAREHWYPSVRRWVSIYKYSVAAAVPGAAPGVKGLLKLIDPQCYVPHDESWKGATQGGTAPEDLAHFASSLGNVFAIVSRRQGAVLLQKSGTVSLLDRGADGRWKARPSQQLPGPPLAYRAMPDGGIAVATVGGTIFLGAKAEVDNNVCNDPDLDRGPAVLPNPDWFTSFAVPTPRSSPQAITVGPDGALWFLEVSANKVGRLTPAGAFTEYVIPTPDCRPTEIIAGRDGALWFTETTGNRIGRITVEGVLREFPLPADALPASIAAGSDGALWFTGGRESIGRITTSGAVKLFPLPSAVSEAVTIVAGADRALWFTAFGESASRVGRLTTSGKFTIFDAVNDGGGRITSFVAGTDGALWWGDKDSMRRFTTSGKVSAVPAPGLRQPYRVAMTQDGTIWITSWKPELGRLTAKGAFTRFDASTFGSGFGSLAAGPDGAVWITDSARNRIVRLAPPATP